VHAHVTPFSGTFAGDVLLTGTLTPSLPGLNTLSLSIRLPSGQAAQGGKVALILSMPGMTMLSIRATLSAHGHGYEGHVPLPMFGPYRAQVAATALSGHYTGTLRLTLRLLLESTGRWPE
jgi:hypothetical protein